MQRGSHDQAGSRWNNTSFHFENRREHRPDNRPENHWDTRRGDNRFENQREKKPDSRRDNHWDNRRGDTNRYHNSHHGNRTNYHPTAHQQGYHAPVNVRGILGREDLFNKRYTFIKKNFILPNVDEFFRSSVTALSFGIYYACVCCLCEGICDVWLNNHCFICWLEIDIFFRTFVLLLF